MPRVVALRIQDQAVVAVAVASGSAPPEASAVVRLTLAPGESPQDIGRRLAAALAEHRVERAVAVVAVPRADIHWQSLDLPPSPDAELPDMVRMQAQRDLPLDDDGAGLDFVSLYGDAEHPHHVLAFSMAPAALERLHAICSAADLKLRSVVPEPLGWFELDQLSLSGDEAAELSAAAAITGRQAVVWGSQRGALRMLRIVWLPADEERDNDPAPLAHELRRTLLALSNLAGASASAAPCRYLGQQAEQAARELSAALGRPIEPRPLDSLILFPPDAPVGITEAAPLVALASSAAAGRRPLVDLLHPRQPPAPPSRMRTLTLAVAAAASLMLLAGWTAYQRLQTPLRAAAEADAARAELAPVLERFARDEAQTAAIQAWLDQSTNLLTEIEHLGRQLRPEPLASDEFAADADLVLTKLSLSGQQVTIEAAARSTDALPQIERRLREGRYRVSRGVVDTKSEAVPNYGAAVSATLVRVADGDAAEATP